MMKKPLCTRILASLAIVTVCISLLFNNLAILFPDAFLTVYWDSLKTPELPMFSTALLFAGAASILPFAVICAINVFTVSMSWTKSLVSLILSGLFWMGGNACDWVFSLYASATAGSADAVAVIAAINQARNFLPILNAIALTLICSALAIELYILKVSNVHNG